MNSLREYISNASMVKIFFAVFVLMYVLILLINPHLGPSDEYHFLPTLQSGKIFPMYGKDFPYYNSVELGRFSPLGGQEYNLVALISNTPPAYFVFNAILLSGFIIIFLKILREFRPIALLIICGCTPASYAGSYKYLFQNSLC